MDRTEVTTAAYAACVSAGKCTRAHTGSVLASCNAGVAGREQHPINCVDWNQADAYCQAQGLRLPTEEEWEYAATGGDGRTFSWGNEWPSNQLCWNRYGDGRTYPNSTCAVGSYPNGRSPFGVDDMSGNVSDVDFIARRLRFYTRRTRRRLGQRRTASLPRRPPLALARRAVDRQPRLSLRRLCRSPLTLEGWTLDHSPSSSVASVRSYGAAPWAPIADQRRKPLVQRRCFQTRALADDVGKPWLEVAGAPWAHGPRPGGGGPAASAARRWARPGLSATAAVTRRRRGRPRRRRRRARRAAAPRARARAPARPSRAARGRRRRESRTPRPPVASRSARGLRRASRR